MQLWLVCAVPALVCNSTSPVLKQFTTLFLEPNKASSTPVGLLDSSSRWCRLASCLGGQLLAWGLATGGLAGGLLGTSHDVGV